MMKFYKLSFAALLVVTLSACTFSFNNDLVSSHPDEVEAFTADAFDDFYAKRTQDILRKAPKEAGFTADQLEAIYEFMSETAVPGKAVAADRSYRRQNATKYFVTIFHTPRDKGREVVTVTVSGEGEDCCKLYGLHINHQIGEPYLMETETVESSTPEE